MVLPSTQKGYNNKTNVIVAYTKGMNEKEGEGSENTLAYYKYLRETRISMYRKRQDEKLACFFDSQSNSRIVAWCSMVAQVWVADGKVGEEGLTVFIILFVRGKKKREGKQNVSVLPANLLQCHLLPLPLRRFDHPCTTWRYNTSKRV